MQLFLGNRRLRYDLLGPADGPVICMAHTLSSDSGIWSEQVPALLGAGWRVLRIDMRGHGGSEPGGSEPGGSEAGEGPCTMADLAGDVIAVLDFLGLERVHFAGVSIGGMIGQVLGIDHGHRVQSLMLCGTSAQAVPGGQAMWDARFAAIRAANSVEPLADDTIARWFTASYRRADRLDQVRHTIATTTPDGYIHGAQAIIAFDVRASLPRVQVPTLVLCGDDDPGTPAEGNRLIASLIPGARYVEVPDARHIPMMQHPDAFNRILLDWLASCR